ncbi:hypothetical protein ACIRU8_42715 [Streptomyces sp. NPDC101175]|uniref:hypothetical protein n=1 Tax=Streptomyces sp. NPDC101175 TaxID=3366123 RepID=UPI00383877AC
MYSFAKHAGRVVDEEQEGGVQDVLAQFDRHLQYLVALRQIGDEGGGPTHV